MCVCVCVCATVWNGSSLLSISLIRGVHFSRITGGGGGVVCVGEGGGALYVLLMPIVVHQQSLQLQLLTAASWGTEQSWPRKGCSLDGIWGLFVMFLFFYFPSLFVVLTVVVCAHAMKCMSSKSISIKGPMLSRKWDFHVFFIIKQVEVLVVRVSLWIEHFDTFISIFLFDIYSSVSKVPSNGLLGFL